MDPDLQKLIELWISDDWDLESEEDATLAKLAQRLQSDDAFRRSFVAEIATMGQLKAVQSSEPRWLKLEDRLGCRLDEVTSDFDFEAQVMSRIDGAQPEVGTRDRRWLLLIATSAVVLVGLGSWLFSGRFTDSGSDPLAERSETRENAPVNRGVSVNPSIIANPVSVRESAIAVLSQSVDAKWAGKDQIKIGDPLRAGRFVLKRGTVQIEFFAGVRLLVRAPADFELLAADEVLLREGSASCFVTEMGHGFKVTTADMEVVDLGTAFSIVAKNGQQSEVHVLEGSVEIKSHGKDAIELTELQAMRAGATGMEPVEYSPERFPQTSDLRDQLRRQASKAYRRWKLTSEKFSNDPDVLLHYTFEETDPSALELTNFAADLNKASDGMVIGCKWTQGRWPMKRALLYRNTNDRVLFEVPGHFDQLTFIAWVRLDGLTQQNTSLLMTENPVRRQYYAPTEDQSIVDAMDRLNASYVKTVRWELSRMQSNVRFSIGHGFRSESDYERFAAASPATNPERWGKWACMAITCDVSNREVVHYLDGQAISRQSLANAEPLLLDFMELGNFGVSSDEIEESQGDAIRRFYGAFDELLISQRAMTDAEIREFWLGGKP